MQSLALARPRPLTLLVRRPLFWMFIAAIGLFTSLLAGALLGVAALVGSFTVLVLAARRPRLYAGLEWSARVDAWRSRCDARETRLEEATIPTQGLQEATSLVRDIEASDPMLSSQLDLEAMLDDYVALAIRVRRCEVALTKTTRVRSSGRSLRPELADRCDETQTKLQARLCQLRDELESIPELLCLVLQRSALDSTPTVDDQIAQRLAVYDVIDNSLRDVAA